MDNITGSQGLWVFCCEKQMGIRQGLRKESLGGVGLLLGRGWACCWEDYIHICAHVPYEEEQFMKAVEGPVWLEELELDRSAGFLGDEPPSPPCAGLASNFIIDPTPAKNP